MQASHTVPSERSLAMLYWYMPIWKLCVVSSNHHSGVLLPRRDVTIDKYADTAMVMIHLPIEEEQENLRC